MYEDYDVEPYPESDHSVTLNTEITVHWNNSDVIKAVIDQVSARVYDDIKPEVSKAVVAALDDQVNLAIATLLDGKIQPTDRWGKPLGESVSIRKLLQRDAEQWLVEQVDEYGRKGSDGFSRKNPRIHWLFQEALNGQKDQRGKTTLASMVVNAIRATLGDVEAIVNAEVREQVKKKLG